MNIILASQSPRRQELLRGMGFDFTVKSLDIDESFPQTMKGADVVLYLARKKIEAMTELLSDEHLVITADTIVCLDDLILNKPADKEEALGMLRIMSGRKHTVYTGVALKKGATVRVFYDQTDVYFKSLTDDEMNYYIDNYRPFDKAGSYGVQEWIGYVGIERIEGSFYNVMGLPTAKLYDEMMKIMRG